MKILRLTFGLKNKGSKTKSSLTKKSYRFLDLKRHLYVGKAAEVVFTLYDPTRSGLINLIMYRNGVMAYILATEGFTVPRRLRDLARAPKVKVFNLSPNIKLGSSNFLRHSKHGDLVHAIELVPGVGAQISRAAGNHAVILNKHKDTTLVKLKSGAQRLFHSNCIATRGIVSNPDHFLRNFEKAGTSRLLGHRPHVRACSKNPVDHPLGGRTRGGIPQNINGLKPGTATANRKKRSSLEIISARKARHKKLKKI